MFLYINYRNTHIDGIGFSGLKDAGSHLKTVISALVAKHRRDKGLLASEFSNEMKKFNSIPVDQLSLEQMNEYIHKYEKWIEPRMGKITKLLHEVKQHTLLTNVS